MVEGLHLMPSIFLKYSIFEKLVLLWCNIPFLWNSLWWLTFHWMLQQSTCLVPLKELTFYNQCRTPPLSGTQLAQANALMSPTWSQALLHQVESFKYLIPPLSNYSHVYVNGIDTLSQQWVLCRFVQAVTRVWRATPRLSLFQQMSPLPALLGEDWMIFSASVFLYDFSINIKF